MLAIITGTIRPGKDMGQLALTDAEERFSQYIEGLQFLVQTGAFSKIVFCDNSGYPMEELDFLQQEVAGKGVQLELLSFMGDTKRCVLQGKGYGEGELMAYVMSHSRLVREEAFFVKITGRLKVVNIAAISKKLQTDRCYFNVPNRTIRDYYDTKLYGMPITLYKEHFLQAYEQVRDSEGIYLEKVFTRILLQEGIQVFNFPRYPRVLGMAGSTGLTYTYTEWKSKIRDVISLCGGYHVTRGTEVCLQDYRQTASNESLRVLQLNANISATSVPYRLQKAFQRNGIASRILTMQSRVQDTDICEVPQTFGFKVLRKLDTMLLGIEERLRYEPTKGMPFSFFRVGMRLDKHPWVQEADCIIIHWIAGTFLSLHGMERILKLGKPVMLVCHDNWHFTGGCHVRMGCENYQWGCGDCPILHGMDMMPHKRMCPEHVKERTDKGTQDRSARFCLAKKKLYGNAKLLVSSPSHWMDDNVADSIVFAGKNHCVIPNPIDTLVYGPMDKEEARKKLGIPAGYPVLAFGAVNADTTPYKGYDRLMETLEIYQKQYRKEPTVILVFGSGDKKVVKKGCYEMHYLGYLKEEEMVTMYNATDVYVVPSLEDSFNNTVAECLACETPVASFATGGIVDILEHQKTGYLAAYNDAADLAEGIHWVLIHNENNRLGKAGRRKVEDCFSYETVAGIYERALREMLQE